MSHRPTCGRACPGGDACRITELCALEPFEVRADSLEERANDVAGLLRVRILDMVASARAQEHNIKNYRHRLETAEAARDALAAKLATVMAAKEEACAYWRIHLDGAVRRAIAGKDGGHRMEYAAIERLRGIGKDPT